MSSQQTRDLIVQLYRRRGVRPGAIYPSKALWMACLKSGVSQAGFKEATDELIEKGIIDQDCRLLRSLD